MRARHFPSLLLLAAPLAAQHDLAPRLAAIAAHPRLLLTDAALAQRQQAATTDATLRRYVDQAIAQADGCLELADLRRELIGPRLLAVSRECLRRVQVLAFAWRWTGDGRYAARAVHDLGTVAAFADWNPSHFLDVAEMTHAVALGYDWLWPKLSAAERDTLRTAIVRLGLEPGRAAYRQNAWWTRSAFNWNQVCNAGLVLGALAVADDEPELATFVIEHAIASLPTALASYEPDGAWMEGPAYWDYATRYTAFGLAALQTALGGDCGLGDRDGLRRAAWFPLLTAGPTGRFFNFADAGENARIGPSPCVFWLAQRTGEAAFAAAEHRLLRTHRASPLHVVWYVPEPPAPPSPPLAQLFRGAVPVAVFRSAWLDDALFVAVKGGYNAVNHGHLDLGSFVLDALGERWLLDLGSDDYDLPGYFGKQRFGYYRLASHSHNVTLVDDRDQDPKAVAKVLSFSAERANVVFDLGSAWGQTKVRRGIAVVDRAVLVQDELQLDAAHEVAFGLMTRAQVTIGPGGEVVLRSGERELVVRAIEPAGARWREVAAGQAKPQRANAGVRRLELHVRAEAGPLRLAVQLAPRWPEGAAPPPARLLPLAEW
ncbi:MAG: heparinase II/III family protein [Planctomycetes bacterium]|nr:heparinase II/III family protein [Planctomycetota bacterium]